MTTQTQTPPTGLTQADADLHLLRDGPNVLAEPKPPHLLKRIAHHLKDITSLVLLFAVALSAYLAATAGGGWTKTMVIALIVVLNVAISLFQEGRAEKAIASLQSMTTHQVTVIRDGQRQIIPANVLVVDDVMLLNPGDRIAADGELLTATDLLVEEAVLTGESEPVVKHPRLDSTVPEAEYTVFSGTSVLQGTAQVKVTKTGMATALGQIADMLNTTQKVQTPLAQRLNSLGIRLSLIAILGGIISILLATQLYGDSWAESMMTGVSLAIAAVPESLPVIVTLSLAFGVRQMAAKNAIIRQITAVETIGNVTVIASDKTGTLTQNKMTVVAYVDPAGQVRSELAAVALDPRWALASTAELGATSEDDSGSPTELAILRFVATHDIDPAAQLTAWPQLAEAPFSSEKKTMATLHRTPTGYLVVIKGAFDRLTYAEPAVQRRLQHAHDQLAARGLRVLAGGYQTFDAEPGPDWADHLTRLIPLGLMGIQDPPRPEVPDAITEAHRAGIRTVMITGDHVQTARAIAAEIGIIQTEADRVMSGDELAVMSDPELSAVIDDVRVFARTSPKDKLRIVQLWQQHGEVVAMTGDGVNDAPALKAADVGVAMGITGTDVSKNAADMVLVDDNFATIIEAVRQGRTVYQNILKAVEFLVSVNFAQIFTLLIAVLVGWGAPLSAEQMLIINILADGIPGFFLSQEPAEPGIMRQQPISRAASIWRNGLAKRVAVRTSTYVALILGVYALGRFGLGANNAALGMSMLFFVLAIGSVLDMFPIKTRRPISWASLTVNRALTWSVLGTMTTLFIVGLTPSLARLFGVIAIPPAAWLVVIVTMGLPMLVVEVYKRWQHRSELREWMID